MNRETRETKTPFDPNRSPDGWDWSEVIPGPEQAQQAVEPTKPQLSGLATRTSIAVDPYAGHLRSSRGTYSHKDFQHTVIIQGPPPRAPLWRQRRKLSSTKPYPIG